MRTKFSGILTLLLAFVVQIGFAQEKTVTGTVTDDSGLPLPGVNIIIKDTSTGTQSDFDGNYSIDVAQGETLVFTYVGFAEQEKVVGASNTIDIAMKPGNELDEVVVTAYGTTTKKRSAQAITTVTAETIENRPNASVVQSLQGQVAGLNIATNTGQPGANSTVILRGVGSINGNVEPLFVIDGVPVDEDNFRSINPNDIASVSVLKDAAATSIYGSRGANGVIIIETKRGSFNQDLTFQYSSQYGVAELPELNIELMNSKQKLTFEREYGVGRGAGLTDAEINAISNQTNTKWSDYFFRKASTNQHNLSISSGSENTNNFTSIGYLEQEGVFIVSDLQRFNFRNNFTGRTSDKKFNYNANINANFSKSNFSEGAGNRSVFFNPFLNAMQGLPYLTPFDPDGSVTTTGGIEYGDQSALNFVNSPYVLLNSAANNRLIDEEIKIVGNLSADYNFAENFTAGTRFGVDFTSIKNTDLLNPRSLLGPFQTTPPAGEDPLSNEFEGLEDNSYTRNVTFNILNRLNYNKSFGKHTIDATLYTEYVRSFFDGINFRSVGLDPKTLGSGFSYVPGDTTEDLNDDGTLEYPYIDTVGKTNLETSIFSYFGTIDYDYDGRFGFYGSIRRDASIRFTGDKQWGTFFSVSGRWNISEESFMEDTAFNLLKLRASYGTAGNDRILSTYYGALDLYQTSFTLGDGYNNTQGYVVNNLGNNDLQWEQTAQLNFGIDFGLWNNKLQGNIDAYRKKTTELFQSRPISLINGQSAVQANIGSMQNTGLELYTKYTVIDTDDWNLSLNVNGSYNRNEILEIAGGNEDGVVFGGGASALAEGEPIGSFYVVEYAGVNPANGEPLFYDADGNITETLDGDNDRKFSDRSQYPVWQGGFGGTLSYKGFSLSNQWIWFADIHRNNLDLSDLEGTANLANYNMAASALDAWREPGDITSIPAMNGPYSGTQYLNQSDRYVEDASYLRLRNIILGYSFQEKVLEKLPFTGIKIFVQGENLVTFTNWKGWDAEGAFTQTASSNYPTPKVYTMGVNLNF